MKLRHRTLLLLTTTLTTILLSACAGPQRVTSRPHHEVVGNETGLILISKIITKNPAIMESGCDISLVELNTSKSYEANIPGGDKSTMFVPLPPGVYTYKSAFCTNFINFEISDPWKNHDRFSVYEGKISVAAPAIWRQQNTTMYFDSTAENRADLVNAIGTAYYTLMPKTRARMVSPYNGTPITEKILKAAKDSSTFKCETNCGFRVTMSRSDAASDFDLLEKTLLTCTNAPDPAITGYFLGALKMRVTFAGGKLAKLETLQSEHIAAKELTTCVDKALAAFTPQAKDFTLDVTF